MNTGPGFAGASVLHEIRHRLAALIDEGTEAAIDLRALPLSDPDIAHIETVLGPGEVSASIESLGRTEIRETSVPGVWIVEHLSPNGKTQAKLVEITRCPALLQTQREDARAGLRRLDEKIASDGAAA